MHSHLNTLLAILYLLQAQDAPHQIILKEMFHSLDSSFMLNLII